jgi:hypothetical protein
MQWCFEQTAEEHKIDRFHIKCAEVMNDGSIAVVARGRTPGMKMQVTTLVLRFDVDHLPNGKMSLRRRPEPQLLFPTIFCRQLDHVQRYDDHLVVVNDNSVEDEMAIMDLHLNPQAMRKNLVGFHVHTEHRLINQRPL